MAFATASSPANRKPGDNAQTTTPPQAQARPRQSPGKTEPQRARPPRVQEPQRAPDPASAHRAPSVPGPPQRAPGPQHTPGPPPAHDRTPGARRDPRARQDRQRAPGRKPGGFAADHVLVSRTPPHRTPDPQRAPGRKPGSGALAGPSSGLRGANRADAASSQSISRAKQRAPRGEESPILSSRGQNKRFFAASGPKRTIIRAIGKPIRAQPTKTSVSHFRDREKPSVLTASDQN